MINYKHFTHKIKNKLSSHINEHPVLRIQTESIEDIKEKASEYFNMPIENLNFEIESITKPAAKKQYSIISYPKIDYQGKTIFETDSNNRDGRAFVRFDESGNILLLVMPPVGEGKNITFNEVIEIVQKRTVHSTSVEIDTILIKDITFEANNNWVFIAKYYHDENDDVKYTVSLSEDEMIAYIYMIPPGLNGADPSRKKMNAILHSKNVVYGIDEDMLLQLECIPQYREPIAVAYGTEVQHGENAWIKLIASIEEDTLETQNQYDLAHTLKLVKKGDIVAKKIPLTYGKEGYTVTNQVVFPEPGNDITMIPGKNVNMNLEGTSITSLKDGVVKLIQEKKVSVENLLIIDSNLSLEIGNINFPGSVLIKGDIPDDFELNIEGDLQVYGGIANSNLHVEGNLIVGHGIKGRGNAQIYVEGTIFSKFIESANLIIGKDCVVNQSIISSQVLVKGRVLVVEGRGRIMSSTLVAGMDIFVCSIGSELGESSTIEIKSIPKLWKLYDKLIFTKKEKIGMLNVQKRFLRQEDYDLAQRVWDKKIDVSNNSDLSMRYETIMEKLKNIQKLQIDIKNIIQKLKILNEYLIKEKSVAQLHVLQKINEGTTISIDSAKITTKNDLQQVVFYLNRERISVRDYNVKTDKAKLDKVMHSVKQ